jgi:hypothetical protein
VMELEVTGYLVLCRTVLYCAVLCCAVLCCRLLCRTDCTVQLGAEDRGENQQRRGMSLQTDSRRMVPDQKKSRRRVCRHGSLSSCFQHASCLPVSRPICSASQFIKTMLYLPQTHTHCQNSVQPQLHSFTPRLPIPIPPLLPLLGPKSCT